MTRIDFYVHAPNPLRIAHRLVRKAHAQGMQVFVQTCDAQLAAGLDRQLWIEPAGEFIPHCRDTDPLAGETPVLIGTQPERLARADVLINLDPACPPHYARFERLLEIVGPDADSLAAARERWRFYQDRGYLLMKHDLAELAEP